MSIVHDVSGVMALH